VNKLPNFNVSVAVACIVVGFMSTSCFKKGEGKGTRKVRPSPGTVGDIFVPGPGNKPGSEKPSTTPEQMDSNAKAILAECFGIEVKEVADIVGWTDPSASSVAAKALCADLDAVNYDGGTIANTAAPVEVD